MHVTSFPRRQFAAWLGKSPRLPGGRSMLLVASAFVLLAFAGPTVRAQVDDVPMDRRQPAAERPPRDPGPGTADGPSRDTTAREADAPKEKPRRSGDDGGSDNATGAAAAVAAIVTGVIAVTQQQKRKQLAACEQTLRSLRGQSIGDALTVLEPAEYEVHQRSRVRAPADADVAEGAVLEAKARKIRDGKCVVTLVSAESTPALVAEVVPIEAVAGIPESAPAPRPVPPPRVTQTVVADRPREPAQPPVPAACRTPIAVASFVGGTRADAESWSEPYDLQLVETRVPSTRREGEVLRQQPDAPAQVRCGAALELTVSDGTLVVVPAVATLNVERARALIESTELVSDATDADSDGAPGAVLEQSPAAGVEVPRGSMVRIVIATGLLVPDVTGLGLVEALQRLQAFQVVPTLVESNVDKDLVARQSPVGGSRAAAGSRVALDVSSGPWPPPWLFWLVAAALLALGAVALRYLLPRVVHASGRLDADRTVRTESPIVAVGPSLRVDAHLERGHSRVMFPGEAA